MVINLKKNLAFGLWRKFPRKYLLFQADPAKVVARSAD
jgi:hypothetical protein